MTTGRISIKEPSSLRSPTSRVDAHVSAARLTVLECFDDLRGPHMCSQEVLAIVSTTGSARECVFVVIFGSSLFCAGERNTDLHIVLDRIGPYVGKYMRFF